jgi:hypothetical protein
MPGEQEAGEHVARFLAIKTEKIIEAGMGGCGPGIGSHGTKNSLKGMKRRIICR